MKITMTENELMASKDLFNGIGVMGKELTHIFDENKAITNVSMPIELVVQKLNRDYNKVLHITQFENAVGTRCYTLSIKENFILESTNVYGGLISTFIHSVIGIAFTMKNYINMNMKSFASRWGLTKAEPNRKIRLKKDVEDVAVDKAVVVAYLDPYTPLNCDKPGFGNDKCGFCNHYQCQSNSRYQVFLRDKANGKVAIKKHDVSQGF